MSLISTIGKYGLKTLGFGKRILKDTTSFLISDSSDAIGQGIRNQSGSIFKKGKAGFKALEDYANNNSIKDSFKRLSHLPKEMSDGYKVGASTAKAASKSSLWGGFKGSMKALGKRMPIVGALLTVAFEVPNLYRAFTEGGFSTGMKEVGGATIELGTMATCAAIGSAICPGAGTVIGGIIGAIGGCLLRGETYSEKKDAEEEATKAPENQNNNIEQEAIEYSEDEIKKLKDTGFTEEEIKALGANGYTMSEIEKALEETKPEQETYTSDEINTLKKLGYSNDEIEYLAGKGYTLKEIENILKIKEEQTNEKQEPDVLNVSNFAEQYFGGFNTNPFSNTNNTTNATYNSNVNGWPSYNLNTTSQTDISNIGMNYGNTNWPPYDLNTSSIWNGFNQMGQTQGMNFNNYYQQSFNSYM